MATGSEHRAVDRGRICIAGGGLIGLGCAFELASRGFGITVLDPQSPQASASWAAAGMIAPAYEMLMHGDAPLTDICFNSADLWEGFARRVQAASDRPVGFDPLPTLALARTDEEVARLDALCSQLEARNVPAHAVTADRVRALYGLSGAVKGAVELPSDAQVDNRRLMSALHEAIVRLGGRFVRAAVFSRQEVARAAGFEPDHIVWARGLAEFGVSSGVKGEALSLAPLEDGPARVFRFGSYQRARGGFAPPTANCWSVAARTPCPPGCAAG